MRARAFLLGAVAIVSTLSFGAPAHATGATVRIQMSNFRYCPDIDTRPGGLPCDPLDVAYIPYESTGLVPGESPGAPIQPQYNPVVTINVHPGDTVVWTYRDSTGCDSFSLPQALCRGHQVKFVYGKYVGMVNRQQEGSSISFTIPTNFQPGTYLPYYCPVNMFHYGLGMIGVLKVV
ncbi:MAG: cupredoxin domain-containing protein [Actinomycetota bacterium]